MKKFLLLNLLFILPLCAQDATQYIFANGSDINGYKFARSQPDNFGFDPVELSGADYTFRLTWCYNSAILYKNQGKYYGWAKTYITNSDNHEEVFGMTYAIDSVTVKNLVALVDSANIRPIKSGSLTDGWNRGLDGIGYCIEEKRNGSYSYKTYHSPEHYNFPEAAVIASFIRQFNEISNFYQLTAPVYGQRPFQYYGVGCGVAGIKVLTKSDLKKETEIFEQRRQNYLDIREREAALKPKE